MVKTYTRYIICITDTIYGIYAYIYIYIYICITFNLIHIKFKWQINSKKLNSKKNIIF